MWYCICMNCGRRHEGELPMECLQCGETKFLSHLLKNGEVFKDTVTNQAEIIHIVPEKKRKIRRK
jgi:hypothetical protein